MNPASFSPGAPAEDNTIQREAVEDATPTSNGFSTPQNNHHPAGFERTKRTPKPIRPYKFDAVLANPVLDQKILEEHAWNPDDRSLNVFVKNNDPFTFQRRLVPFSTDCIRGKVGYTNGFHVWKVTWPVQQRYPKAVIGVATKDAPLHADGSKSLIGRNAESYGWVLNENRCAHKSKHFPRWVYPNVANRNGQPYVAPSNIYCILDMEEGTLAFASDRNYLGVAFRGLKGKKLYPIVSCVWDHREVTMKYIGGLDREPRQLMDTCRRTIISKLEKEKKVNDDIATLPLPPSMKNFLMYLP